jgi:tetratricopeptide (TPR) repeat protein
MVFWQALNGTLTNHINSIKMKQSISIFILLLIVNFSFAQQNEQVIKAFEKSYAYAYEYNYNEAINEIKQVYDNQSYPINLRLAWLNYANQNYTESIIYYKQAISIAPKSIEARLGYTYPASAVSNWDEVMKQYNEILKLDSENSKASYGLAAIYYYREDFDKAYELLLPVVEHYPFDYDSSLLMGWVLLKRNEKKKALQYFQNVLLYSPNDESAKAGIKILFE